MTSRTPIRNDDAKSAKDSQRPINETVRDLSFRVDELARREQVWVRFTCVEADSISSLIGQTIRAPYAVAAIVVLAVQMTGAAATTLTAAPWLSIEPVDGDPNTARITNAYGVPQSGTFDCLVEFVENMTATWPRTDVTGGAP
jgi:hypothetical protein